MGQMRFIVPCPDKLPEGSLERAYLSGIEGIPWRANTRWQKTSDSDRCELVIERTVSESGNLFIPWFVEGVGQVVLSTACLMERSAPYHLTVELARGSLNQVRCQTSDWQSLGLQVPDGLRQLLKQASDAFAAAVTADDPAKADERAEAAIVLSHAAGEQLMDEYSRQALQVRHQQDAQLPTMLGVRLAATPLSEDQSRLLRSAANTVALPLSWGSVETELGRPDWSAIDERMQWCCEHELRVVGGPLLELHPQSLPAGVQLHDDGFSAVQTHVDRHVEAVVRRYGGRVQIWNCSAGMNMQSRVDLCEEKKLRLVVSVMDKIRQVDSVTPLVVSFDQPWGEYLAFDKIDLSPLHFADSLVRAELGVSGIGLEINFGYWPHGTLPRSRLAFSRMLDRWSMFNLPLILFIAIPGGESQPWKNPEGIGPVTASGSPLTAARQHELAAQLLPVALAKSFVQGVIWNQLSDGPEERLWGAGLLDVDGHPKPILELLSELRRKHLR